MGWEDYPEFREKFEEVHEEIGDARNGVDTDMTDEVQRVRSEGSKDCVIVEIEHFDELIPHSIITCVKRKMQVARNDDVHHQITMRLTIGTFGFTRSSPANF